MGQAGQTEQTARIEEVSLQQVAPRLERIPAFANSNIGDLLSGQTVALITAPKGTVLVKPGDAPLTYLVILEGKLRADRPEMDGSITTVGYATAGEGSGETPLMNGRPTSSFFLTADEDSVVVRFTDEQFWQLLACCPAIRSVAIEDMRTRVQLYQVEALHREKLVTLGTLSAGLMHELKNPGSAAKRAASTLRENLRRLQELSLRMSEKPKTHEQLICMKNLLEHTIKSCHGPAISSFEQAEAEEALSEWLASASVENAYSIGPALVELGFNQEELECARAEFTATEFSDALNWLGALVLSLIQVCTIEESVGRVTDLVMAVKKFAWGDRIDSKSFDINDSLQTTLMMLGHKLRIKQLKVEKRFNASPALINMRGAALGQVWTNLIDNAADASPMNGQIDVETWTEPGWLVVSIGDNGSGISPDVMPHIFEPFFTTKPQGVGTGLGLDIVYRIVTQKYDGRIDVESAPGKTRFIVRLPQ